MDALLLGAGLSPNVQVQSKQTSFPFENTKIYLGVIRDLRKWTDLRSLNK